MENAKATNGLKKLFEKTFNEMTLDELKKIDWLTWETDFFIEKDKQDKVA